MNLSSQFVPSYPAGTTPDLAPCSWGLQSGGCSWPGDKSCLPTDPGGHFIGLFLLQGFWTAAWLPTYCCWDSTGVLPGSLLLSQLCVGALNYSRHASVYLRTCALIAFVYRLQHGLSEDATLKRNYKRSFWDFSGIFFAGLIAWTSQGLWERALGDWISRAEQGRHKCWRAKPGCRALSCLPIPGWPSGSPTITWGCGSHAHLEPTSSSLGFHGDSGHSRILSWLAWNSREMYQLMNRNKACPLS